MYTDKVFVAFDEFSCVRPSVQDALPYTMPYNFQESVKAIVMDTINSNFFHAFNELYIISER